MNQKNRESRAVRLYVKLGVVGGDEPRVIDEFGKEEGAKLVQYAKSIVSELDVKVDWSTESLEGAAKRIVDAISSRHPELDHEALQVLRTKFCYDWK